MVHGRYRLGDIISNVTTLKSLRVLRIL
jgi:hypothetical protein